MRREVAADEMRCARACAPARRAVARGRDDVRMIGEAEIIVAREGDEPRPSTSTRAPVADSSVRRFRSSPAASSAPRLALEIGDRGAQASRGGRQSQFREQRRGRHPRRDCSVVRSLSPWKIELAPARKHSAWTASPSSRRPADSRTIAFGIVIRATAIVRTNSNGSSALSAAERARAKACPRPAPGD